jgi:hypothetical protein
VLPPQTASRPSFKPICRRKKLVCITEYVLKETIAVIVFTQFNGPGGTKLKIKKIDVF